MTAIYFSRLYLACQGRDGDVDQFFSHENHACPRSDFDYIRMDISEQHANMKDSPSHSVLPRPFSEGGTPCPFLVTPCPFQKAEMTPCPFFVTPNDALLHFT